MFFYQIPEQQKRENMFKYRNIKFNEGSTLFLFINLHFVYKPPWLIHTAVIIETVMND